jgi:hypothetical protein
MTDMKMENVQQSQKRVYVTPKLIVHGTVEQITAGCNKALGMSDGFTFQGQAITCS